MWRVTNHTRYMAAGTWGRDKDGRHQWIVAVKATYHLSPDGEVSLAAEQLEPLVAPEYCGEPGVSSLRYESDLVARKPTTDVILNGTAFAPGGRPTSEFTVSMSVGEIRKTLKVKGSRTWSRRPLGPSAPEPVASVPIVYERAYGGFHANPTDPTKSVLDERNPVGCGLPKPGGGRIGDMMPNFEYSSGRIEQMGPAGFGPIDAWWAPRRSFSGTYDSVWEKTRRPLLPQDWDDRALLCSPPDQRPASHLRGGESVVLVNLVPYGALHFTLPKVHLTFRTFFAERTEEHRGRLSSVVIEPDEHRLIMVWQTWIPCGRDVDYLDETVVAEKAFL